MFFELLLEECSLDPVNTDRVGADSLGLTISCSAAGQRFVVTVGVVQRGNRVVTVSAGGQSEVDEQDFLDVFAKAAGKAFG